MKMLILAAIGFAFLLHSGKIAIKYYGNNQKESEKLSWIKVSSGDHKVTCFAKNDRIYKCYSGHIDRSALTADEFSTIAHNPCNEYAPTVLGLKMGLEDRYKRTYDAMSADGKKMLCTVDKCQVINGLSKYFI